MSLFPELESALDAAAARRYPRRRQRSWARWVAAPVAAVCAAALVVALAVHDDAAAPGAAAAPPVTVSQEALARSQALVAAPTPEWRSSDDRVPHDQLPLVAAEIAARVPYPPGARESMDWAGTPTNAANMAAISARRDVQFLVEYRAACTWAQFWLFARQAGDGPALAGATAVLQDIPRWPALRGSLEDPYERTVGWPLNAKAAAAGDPAPLRQYAAGNCSRIPSPYAAAIR